MKPFLMIVALLLSACVGDFGRIDAEVEVLGLMPPVAPTAKASAVLYRVVAPAELAGKYGIDYTQSSYADVERKKGMVFKIRRSGKWRHLLSGSPPLGASVSAGEDFFSFATPK